MKVVYALEPFPDSCAKSVFLAGPTPRSRDTKSWRPEALRILEAKGYDGVVFVPETADGAWKASYQEQIDWETEGLNRADCILFWVPRDLTNLPAFTTNIEFGEWHKSGKIVFGAPEGAAKVAYLFAKAERMNVPTAKTLEATINAALAMIGNGAPRFGGECQVPLCVWSTGSFQAWYQAQKKAGNRLDGARVEWTFRVGPGKKVVFLWAVHVDVFIAAENRNKTNEVVVSRPDISTVALIGPDRAFDTEIVLIREFRSPASTPDGCVREVPGGSSFKPKENAFAVAAAEVREETGLEIDSGRVHWHGDRQLMATLSAHKAHLFSARVTDAELAWLRGQAGIAHGVAEDTERTFVELRTIRELLTREEVDWSMMGMILTAHLTNPSLNRKP